MTGDHVALSEAPGVGVRVDLEVDVVLVVDPVRPGAALVRTEGGETLLDLTARLATAETGMPACPPLDEDSTTAAVDALVALLAERADRPLAVIDGAALATATAFGDVVADPRPDAGMLRGNRMGGAPASEEPPVVVRVPSAARARVAGALPGTLARGPGERVLDLLCLACADAGVDLVDRTDPTFPVWLLDQGADVESAWSVLSAVDERRARGRRAQRADDGFLSTFLVRPLSRRLTPIAVARGLRPTSVTVVALVLGLLAALAYAGAATGHGTAWRVLGSVLLLASLVVDCVDGEVARYTRTFSARGGWWDVGADRVKEYAIYGGLAAGAAVSAGASGTDRTSWWLALAALALLVVRHFVDFGYAAGRTGEGGSGQAAADPVASWSAQTSRRPVLMWAKRAVIMPVGERTLLLIVLAPTIGVRATLVVQLVLGAVAFCWTTAGRLGRTLLGAASGRHAEDAGAARLVAQVDAGPVPATLWPVRSPAGWLLPALARAVELGVSAVLVWRLADAAVPVAYAWLAVVSLGLYDLVYRQRLAGEVEPPAWRAGFGWPVRLVLLVVLLALGGSGVVQWVLGAAACALLLAQVVGTARFWGRWVPSRP